jgi:hypothetical protein
VRDFPGRQLGFGVAVIEVTAGSKKGQTRMSVGREGESRAALVSIGFCRVRDRRRLRCNGRGDESTAPWSRCAARQSRRHTRSVGMTATA